MASSTFAATVRAETGIAVVDLQGDVNGFAEDAIERAYRDAARSDPSTILLNFDDVSYINSTGIALIVGLLAHARKDRRRVLVCGLSEHYREIFSITRLSDFMSIFPDEASAIAEAGAAAADK
jgi:anti-anti-sigma factor